MSQAQPPRPITGRKVLFMLVAFFGVVIGVNLVMMRLAIQTLPGTEVDSAYSASLAYEKEIATARAQTARNWKVDAHVERSGQGGATLQVEARDNLGRPMSGLTFQGRFERPTDRRADPTEYIVQRKRTDRAQAGGSARLFPAHAYGRPGDGPSDAREGRSRGRRA